MSVTEYKLYHIVRSFKEYNEPEKHVMTLESMKKLIMHFVDNRVG